MNWMQCLFQDTDSKEKMIMEFFSVSFQKSVDRKKAQLPLSRSKRIFPQNISMRKVQNFVCSKHKNAACVAKTNTQNIKVTKCQLGDKSNKYASPVLDGSRNFNLQPQPALTNFCLWFNPGKSLQYEMSIYTFEACPVFF